ncbi:MAG: SDR family oxidoreductase [Spirochaetales bacterium]|nr:SDR family oxidoreductase [Spirochaetales bacterium]
MELGLTGKIVVVTGATKGIGLAVARGFAAEGAHVALCSRTKGEASKAAEQIAGEFGVKSLGLQADVVQRDDLEAFTKGVSDHFGGVDILINNAGLGSEEKIVSAADERWQYWWDLTVMAAIRLTRSLVPLMKQRGGGVITNIASICAKQPLAHEPIYDTVKAALVMMSKCLSNEVMADNIRVNSVNPGLVKTPAWMDHVEPDAKAQGISVDEYLQNIAKQWTPIGRFATPEEVANFIVFLCSEKASYCVGSSYYIDGGWLNVTT